MYGMSGLRIFRKIFNNFLFICMKKKKNEIDFILYKLIFSILVRFLIERRVYF